MVLQIQVLLFGFMVLPFVLVNSEAPNIIYVLVDDVGWADFNYNVNGNSSIPTPNIDQLAAKGIKLKSHYAQSTCTPSRAALLTGRYAVNTGLTFAMLPPSVAGLPEDMPTMPRLLRKAGYSAHMIGKWHLGHSQMKQTPVGRGFESHTGSFMFDFGSYTKLMWESPWKQMGIDWIKAFENGTIEHKAELRHATDVITDEAIKKMEETKHEEKPLFLYVSYNAAHSPLQPDPESATKCIHIPHLWRRQYCGMVVGLDTAIGKIVDAAKEKLGPNTVVVVSSDNGGSVWFGGMNEPLRSGKSNGFEGGVRVPAFVVDLGGNYLGKQAGTEFESMVHISDWLPTFLSWANAKHLLKNLDLDGVDQSEALLTGKQARSEVLLDMYSPEYSHDGRGMIAFRKGKYKLIKGDIRDPYWYSEPTSDQVNTTDPSWYPRTIIINIIRVIDSVFGEEEVELWRYLLRNVLYYHYARKLGHQVLLFDLEQDISEKHNIADQHPEIVKELLDSAEKINMKQPKQAKYWFVVENYQDITIQGDCSGTSIPQHLCQFIHPWISDDVNLESIKQVDGYALVRRQMIISAGSVVAFGIFLLFSLFYACCVKSKKQKVQ